MKWSHKLRGRSIGVSLLILLQDGPKRPVDRVALRQPIQRALPTVANTIGRAQLDHAPVGQIMRGGTIGHCVSMFDQGGRRPTYC
jgi:hypothetical protein